MDKPSLAISVSKQRVGESMFHFVADLIRVLGSHTTKHQRQNDCRFHPLDPGTTEIPRDFRCVQNVAFHV